MHYSRVPPVVLNQMSLLSASKNVHAVRTNSSGYNLFTQDITVSVFFCRRTRVHGVFINSEHISRLSLTNKYDAYARYTSIELYISR